MGRKETKDLQEQMGAGQACAPASWWLFLLKVNLIFTQGKKVIQYPKFSMV